MRYTSVRRNIISDGASTTYRDQSTFAALPEYAHLCIKDHYDLYGPTQSLSMTAFATPSVPNPPPRSLLVSPSSIALLNALSRRFPASFSPIQSSIIEADQIVPIGLARPLPMMSKAEPWTGSKRLGVERSGASYERASVSELARREFRGGGREGKEAGRMRRAMTIGDFELSTTER